MNIAVVLGSGMGERIGAGKNKILLELGEKPVIAYSLEAFEKCEIIDKIMIVAKKEEFPQLKKLAQEYSSTKFWLLTEGGKERQDSVFKAIDAVLKETSEEIKKKEIFIGLHNAANPFVSQKEIKDSFSGAGESGACAVGRPAKDTIKRVDEEGFVVETLDRSKLWNMQTPQVLRLNLAEQGIEKVRSQNISITDDVSLVEKLQKPVKIVKASEANFKITTPFDYKVAKLLSMQNNDLEDLLDFKVGFGQDSHRFSESSKPLVLGGLKIEKERGLEANSDGDVVIHALCDALEQAIGGESFSSYADDLYQQGIRDSKEYLRYADKHIKEKEYQINNIGITVEAKKPKINPISEKIKESLAEILGINSDAIGINSTSGENLSTFGEGEGVQAFALVSLAKTFSGKSNGK